MQMSRGLWGVPSLVHLTWNTFPPAYYSILKETSKHEAKIRTSDTTPMTTVNLCPPTRFCFINTYLGSGNSNAVANRPASAHRRFPSQNL